MSDFIFQLRFIGPAWLFSILYPAALFFVSIRFFLSANVCLWRKVTPITCYFIVSKTYCHSVFKKILIFLWFCDSRKMYWLSPGKKILFSSDFMILVRFIFILWLSPGKKYFFPLILWFLQYNLGKNHFFLPILRF